MRAVVFGGNGMLGRAVAQELRRRHHQVLAATHSQCSIADPAGVSYWLRQGQADVAINCAGVIPERFTTVENAIATNAVGPRVISRMFSGFFVHVSTDCVFSGRRLGGTYSIHDVPDPVDVYGWTKALGEVKSPNVTVIRTSFIGFQHGLLAWLLKQQGKAVDGWGQAFWSGSTVYAVARGIANYIEQPRHWPLEHLATATPTSKFEVLQTLTEKLRLDVGLQFVNAPKINRGLAPTLCLPSFDQAVEDLVDEYRSRLASGAITR